MKKYLPLLASGLYFWLSACGQTQVSSESKAIIPNDPQTTLDLGKGYDSLSGEARGDCVIRSEPEIVTASNGKSVELSITKIESASDLFTQLDVSAEASYGGMVSGKGKFARETKVNDYSIFIVGKVKVQLLTAAMRDVQLKADAFQLADDSFSRFLERCGNEYVVARTNGGDLYIVLEIRTKSKAEKRNLEASLSGSYGVFSGSASFSQKLESLITSNSAQFRLYEKGGVYTQASLTAQEVIQRVTNFPLVVNQANSWPVTVTTAKYTTLALPTIDNPFDLNKRQQVLSDVTQLMVSYENYQNSIQYALTNSNEFINVDNALLNSKLLEVNGTLNALQKTASDCYNLSSECNFTTSISFPNKSDLPQRIEKFDLLGCMDSNATNYVKLANKPDTCQYDMDALVNFQSVSPVSNLTASRTYNYKTSGLRSDTAINECIAKYKNISLRDHRGGRNVSYRPINTSCTFRKPATVKDTLNITPFPGIIISRPR